jgi:hypothetical protein
MASSAIAKKPFSNINPKTSPSSASAISFFSSLDGRAASASCHMKTAGARSDFRFATCES